MKVLVLATEDYLGAGKASLRVYQALKKGGYEVCFLVKKRVNNYDSNILEYGDIISSVGTNKIVSTYYKVIRRLRKEVKTDPEYYFFGLDDERLKMNVKEVVKRLPFVPDIIIATWISRFINPKILFKFHQLTGARIILYPMDMSTFTGGCHYAWDCKGYQNECHNCPAILNPVQKEIAHKNWKQKKLYYKKGGVKIIPVSHQLLDEVTFSSLFKTQRPIEQLLIPVDEKIFNSLNRGNAKLKFGLPGNAKVIFFGSAVATEKRKGLHLFVKTLIRLKEIYTRNQEEYSEVVVMLAGNKPAQFLNEYEMPFETFFTGYINDDQLLSLAYQAAEIFVSSSIQDSGPMMINESVMCGTPVVAFDIGVVPDLIINGFSGFKIPITDTNEFAEKLYYILHLNFEQKQQMIEYTTNIGLQNTSFKSFNEKFKKKIQTIN